LSSRLYVGDATQKMEYSEKVDQERNLCTVIVTGVVLRPKDSMVLQHIAKQYRINQGIGRFLFDMRGAIIQGKMMDAFNAAAQATTKLNMTSFEYQVALVYQGDMSDHKFMEDVLVNMGYNLRVFDDIDQAKSWLLKE
jgi:hypothetical protein